MTPPPPSHPTDMPPSGARSHYDTIIVGAGISGLSCAAILKLADPNAVGRVAVYEKNASPGGKMTSESLNGFTFDRAATTVLDRPPEALELVKAVGLWDRWLPEHPRAKNRYIFKNGRRHKAPGGIFAPLEAVFTPIMSFRGKIRMAMEPFIRRGDNAAESMASFATRRLGKDAYLNLLGPFTASLHAADPERLEVESAFPMLTNAENQYGRLFPGMFKVAREMKGGVRRKSRTRSFPTGQHELPDRIAAVLGKDFKPGHRVIGITQIGDGYRLIAEHDSHRTEVDCNTLVLAVDAPVAATLIENIGALEPLHDELAAICYNAMAMVQIGAKKSDIKQSTEGYGHLVALGEAHRTLGVLYSSSLYDGRVPDDSYALFTNFTGGTLDPGVMDLSDDRIVDFVLADLKKSVGLFGDPVMTAVIRWPLAIPQYHIGHAARQRRIADILAEYQNLKIVGSYLNGVSSSTCMQNGVRAAREILASRQSAQASTPAAL